MTICCHSVTLFLDEDIDDERAAAFAACFDGVASSYSLKKVPAPLETAPLREAWEFLWIFDTKLDETFLNDVIMRVAENLAISANSMGPIQMADVEERDWLSESYQSLPPIQVGSFFIHGSHYIGTPPVHTVPLLIEAATAFGSGEHGTTSQCLTALEFLKKDNNFRNILDMGCGSGILAAAAAKLWSDAHILAADNDAECVVVTDRHLAVNNLSHVRSLLSDGYADSSPVWETAPFDLVIANILAAPLIEMAEAQSRAVSAQGYLILSGTLAGDQEARVKAAYEAQGLIHVKTFPMNEWVTILMRKP